MADALTRGDLPVADCHRHYAGHVSRFLHLVTEGPGFELAHKRPVQLTPAQSRFIERIDMQLPEPLDAEAARGAIAGLVPWFLGLQRKDDPLRRQLTDELQAISGFPERTRRFIRKSAGTRWWIEVPG